jgi:hypothetical protein
MLPMSDRSRYNQGVNRYSATYYKPGGWNAWCQRCGRKVKQSQLTKEWDGLWVCDPCFEERQPQDLIRGVQDLQAVPWASPELPDEFVLPFAVQGLTAEPFGTWTELLWDQTNTLTVQITTGNTLQSAPSQLAVLNGANLIAVQNQGTGFQQDTTQQTGAGWEYSNPIVPSWEILQYTTATIVAPATYALTGLLRGRYGTEQAMTLGTLAAGAPFVYIGQANASTDDQLNILGWGQWHYSPCYIACYSDNGDVVITWVRRSRIPPLWQDEWAVIGLNDNFQAPWDDTAEIYSVDILSAPGGKVVRTIAALGSPQARYGLYQQIADFGAPQASYAVTVYQVDPILGRGQPRSATITVPAGNANWTLMSDQGQLLADGRGNYLQ